MGRGRVGGRVEGSQAVLLLQDNRHLFLWKTSENQVHLKLFGFNTPYGNKHCGVATGWGFTPSATDIGRR